VYLKDILKVALVALTLVTCGCGGLDTPVPGRKASSAEVVLAVGQSQRTRTAYDADTKSFVWQPGDNVSVWAESASGTFALEGTSFSLLARKADNASAYFTTKLDSPMAEGTYSYYVTYPVPESVSGTTATFTVPTLQDGKGTGGVDILVGEPAQGGALQTIAEGDEPVAEDVMNIKMKHLLHFLRFYVPEGCNAFGEPVTTIEFSMPKNIAGQVSVDVTDASTAALSGGSSSMTLELADPLTDEASSVAVAGIFPPSEAYSDTDLMTVKLYSENKEADASSVSLAGRTFAAGHITPVPLKPTGVRNRYWLKFTLASNNLGEDPQKITLTLADGSAWPDGTSSALSWEASDGGTIDVGDSYALVTYDESAFRSLSSKSVTVSYESESAIVSETLSLGDLSSVSHASYSVNCPYLFFEDFSTVESFSSNDTYGISSAGSKSAYSFLDGWSAARAGAQAGKAIWIACRRETGLANYSARADSPFLSGLKDGKTVNLAVQFDYSMNRQGTPTISQTVYFGWITTSSSLKSGDGTGTFPVEFSINETTGSYDNIDHTYNESGDVTLKEVKAPLRLSWRTVPETNWGANNNTCWLYIDNVKVKIKK
jgi:hypothetical protein